MRLSTRLGAFALSTVMAFGVTAALAAESDAVQLATLTGSAPSSAHGPGTITFTYTIDLPAAVDSAMFTTHQPAALPAIVSGVTLDGTAVPAGQVTRPNSLDIAVQTGANATDGLSAGAHTITFLATVGTGPTTAVSATATLNWLEGAVPQALTSAPVPVDVNEPDIAVTLSPDSGEDQIGSLGTGREVTLALDVKNLGYGTPHTTLEVDLPTGTTIAPDGVVLAASGYELACAPSLADPQKLLCDRGTLAHDTASMDAEVDVNFITTAAPPVGQLATITVTAAPKPGEGIDTDPSNNSVSAQFRFTGSAALSYTVTPAKSKVHLNEQTTITLTVHNAGPQPAGQTIALAILVGDNFQITGFTGNAQPPTEFESAHARSTSAKAIKSAAADLGIPDDGSLIGGLVNSSDGTFWFIGDIPAGQSASAVLTIKAIKLGTTKIGLFAISDAADPACPSLDCNLTSTTVEAVALAAPAQNHNTLPATTANGDGAELANTGPASLPVLVLGLVMLVVGAGLTLAIRPRERNTELEQLRAAAGTAAKTT
jgi:hypothetical protein